MIDAINLLLIRRPLLHPHCRAPPAKLEDRDRHVGAEEDGLLLPMDNTASYYTATPRSLPQLLRERNDVRREREEGEVGGRTCG
jgi:hypothetical protein